MLKNAKNLFIVMVLLSIVISCKSYHEGDMAVVKEIFSTNGYELTGKELLNKNIIDWDTKSKRAVKIYLSPDYIIKTIPPSISKLEHLLFFNINTNSLEVLPEEFCNLPNLINLRITDSNFKALPDNLGAITSLEILTLEKTKISSLPSSIKQLKELKHLEISTDYINSFPESITSLPTLNSLTLEFYVNNQIIIPPELINCKELQTLEIVGNISTLPKELGILKKLKTLKIYGDAGEKKPGDFTLPPEIYQIRTLEELGLFWCGLDYLPPGISKLTKLKRLDIWENHLQGLPEDIYIMDQWFTNTSEDGYILQIPQNRICNVSPEQDAWLTKSVDLLYSSSQNWQDEQICQ